MAATAKNAVSAFDVAKRICELGEWRVTNLALQKILYIVQMYFMGKNRGEMLLREDFEAWDLGPVVPSVYHKAKIFGSSPVGDVFYSAREIVDPAKLASINEAVPSLLRKTPGQLVAITHWKHGAWAKNYERGAMGIVIPPDDILEEYEKRLAKFNVAAGH